MQNKKLILIVVVSVVILGALIGIYFLIGNKPIGNVTENTIRQNQAGLPAEETSKGNMGSQPSSVNQTIPGENSQTKTEQPQNKLTTDDFSINLPSGWIQTTPAMGTSAMAVNLNEKLNDPAAQKINFKSYFAVSYDKLQGKSMNEYVQNTKNALQQIASSIVFTNEQDMTINDRSAHTIEAELTQQGVNFKVLMILINGKNDDIWIISFNTVKSSWDSYKESFYNTAKSFILK